MSQTPRAIVFLDLPVGTRVIPTALETVAGKVLKLYDPLAKAFARSDESPPVYPADDYWPWFDERFSEVTAMETIEASVSDKRIEWIDYRISLGPGRPFLHLHVAPRGKYDTGSFAYQFVKRGCKHGLRLVGTLSLSRT